MPIWKTSKIDVSKLVKSNTVMTHRHVLTVQTLEYNNEQFSTKPFLNPPLVLSNELVLGAWDKEPAVVHVFVNY